MRELLAEAIRAAVADSKPPPSNEQETCFRIIDPLLRAMGYGAQDIRVQDRDSAKQKPDYSILPDSPEFTWFLEAKAWAVSLNDDHAIQAVNYANTQGKRWVVLSNGREWRLYDNHILGTVDNKLSCISSLEEDGFVSFLEALSKTSIQLSRLEDFVRNERLYSYLASQITSPTSEVIKEITKVVRKVPGLANVPSSSVVGFLRDYASTPSRSVKQSQNEPAKQKERAPAPTVQSKVEKPRAFPLGSISSSAITGTKISALQLPDGKILPLGKWKDLTLRSAIYALDTGRLPNIPFFTSAKSKSPLIAKADSVESTRMREPVKLQAPYEDLLVETHFSADAHQNASLKVLAASGIDPSAFQILMSSS